MKVVTNEAFQADDMDPDNVVTTVAAPWQVGLPSKEYYKNKNMTQGYAETIGKVLEALLHEAERNSTATISVETLERSRYKSSREELVRALVEFETRLAEASPNLEDALDVTKYYNPRTLAETETLLPQISFTYLFANLAPLHYHPDRLIINTPAYLQSLSKTLLETSKETQQAYFVWKVVQAYASKIEHDSVRPLIRFENKVQGKDPDALEERWRKCVKEVDSSLGWILSKFFVGKAFSKAAKDFGDRIVHDIKHRFAEKLEATEWMTEDVRKLGIEKVKNIVQKIGYPTKSPDILDPRALQQFYQSLNISKSSYFENAFSAATFDMKRQFAALGKPTNRDEWDMTVPTVNAYVESAPKFDLGTKVYFSSLDTIIQPGTRLCSPQASCSPPCSMIRLYHNTLATVLLVLSVGMSCPMVRALPYICSRCSSNLISL